MNKHFGEHQAHSTACVIDYGDTQVGAEHGERLLDAILRAGIDHRHVCGGHGFCTSCRVEVVGSDSGLSPVSALERDRLGRDAGKLRLACQTFVRAGVCVRVPRPVSNLFSPDED